MSFVFLTVRLGTWWARLYGVLIIIGDSSAQGIKSVDRNNTTWGFPLLAQHTVQALIYTSHQSDWTALWLPSSTVPENCESWYTQIMKLSKTDADCSWWASLMPSTYNTKYKIKHKILWIWYQWCILMCNFAFSIVASVNQASWKYSSLSNEQYIRLWWLSCA